MIISSVDGSRACDIIGYDVVGCCYNIRVVLMKMDLRPEVLRDYPIVSQQGLNSVEHCACVFLAGRGEGGGGWCWANGGLERGSGER